jgi:TonB-dependent SusC/RagA subfamily outer membrane receptor
MANYNANHSPYNTNLYVDVSNSIAGINIEDIESITVLKSANAAILYGSDGVNGVIVITTKKK